MRQLLPGTLWACLCSLLITLSPFDHAPLLAWQNAEIEVVDDDNNLFDEQNDGQADEQDAATPAPDSVLVTPTTEPPTILAEGLTNPTGIAIQPDTNDIFVADSGAGRIVRVASGQLHEVVTQFPVGPFGVKSEFKTGPLGIAFLDKDQLLVGGGGAADGEELVALYKLPAADSPPIAAAGAEVKFGPLTAADNAPAEGDFFGATLTESALFVTSRGDDQKDWIARATRGKNWGPLERFIPTKEIVGRANPMALITSPRGEIVVGQMGEIESATDSLLTFYAPRTGRLLLNLETGLHDLVALAYSPKTGLLYGIDVAWSQVDQGGLYRLDDARVDGKRACKATRIHPFVRPIALAFAPSGDLFICCFGDTTGEAEPKGSVIRIPAGL